SAVRKSSSAGPGFCQHACWAQYQTAVRLPCSSHPSPCCESRRRYTRRSTTDGRRPCLCASLARQTLKSSGSLFLLLAARGRTWQSPRCQPALNGRLCRALHQRGSTRHLFLDPFHLIGRELCNPARQLLQVLLELIESTYCNLFIGH